MKRLYRGAPCVSFPSKVRAFLCVDVWKELFKMQLACDWSDWLNSYPEAKGTAFSKTKSPNLLAQNLTDILYSAVSRHEGHEQLKP